ncbi:MAG TPA: hypothetical protein VFZ61_21145 [Polyangiales bacterium]
MGGGVRRDLIAAAAVVVAAVLLAWTKFVDGDLGFHLATGREVLATGSIPRTNVLSFTNASYPWHLHQWLPAVLFEWSFREWGMAALQALKVALVAATWLVTYAAARLAGADPLPASVATLLGAGAAAFRFELRPYLFTHLALAGSVAGSAQALRAAARPLARWPPSSGLLWAGAIPVVACHFHAGAIDGWLVLGALALSVALPRRAAGSPDFARRARDAVSIGAVLVASVALAALTLSLYHPYGARILLFPFDMGTDAYLAEHLIEFRAPYQFPLELLAIYWVLAGAAIASWAACGRSLHAFWAVVTLGFLLLSLRHARLAFGFAVVAVPLVALGLQRLLAHLRAALPLLVAAALLLTVVGHRYVFGRPGIGFVERSFPVHLFAYLDQQALSGNIFASDAWAGPLLGHAYPRRRAFFDNRFEAYPRAFFQDVYQRIRYAQPGWDALLDRYHVEIVLMRYTSAGELRFQNEKPNLRQRLAADARWALIYFDDLGVVYVRRDGRNAAQARAHALPGLDPDRMQFLGMPGQSREGLRGAVARGLRSRRLLLMAATAEGDGGDPRQEQLLQQRAEAIPPFDGW